MIELDDSLPEKPHTSPEQPANTHFFADEARSGFDADMESFGAFANTKLPPAFGDFTRTNTGASESLTEKIVQETEKAVVNHTQSIVGGKTDSFFQETPEHEANSIRLSEEEKLAAEDLVANSAPSASLSTSMAASALGQQFNTPENAPPDNAPPDNAPPAFTISLTNEEATTNEANAQAAITQAAIAQAAIADEAKPLSEAQRLADLLAADLTTPPQTSHVGQDGFATSAGVAGASAFGVGAMAFGEISQDANTSNILSNIPSNIPSDVLSIPGETEIAREQQRQLRKQELLNYQHRKKEQQKAAEQFGEQTIKSGRTVAAIVISLFLGAASLAGFFAWRNPALRTSAQEAWGKLTGKPVPPMNTEIPQEIAVQSGSGQNASSQNASAATTDKQLQNSPNAASTQGDSGIVPLDLTQSGSSGMTVAAQDSLNAAKNLASNAPNNATSNSSNNSSNTAVNGASPSNIGGTSTAQNASSMPNAANAKEANTKEANAQNSRMSASNENSPKTAQTLASGAKPTGTLASKSQSAPASTMTSSKGAQSTAQKTLPTAKSDGKTLTQNATATEKSSSAKPALTPALPKENSPKTASQNATIAKASGTPPKANAAQANTAKASAEKSSTEKTNGEKPSAAKVSTLPKTSLEKPTAPYTSNGVFAIQVYASPSQADAEDWVERLRRRGFVNPSMSSQLVRGQLLYRVRFGLYNNLRQAEQDAERYGFAGAWVVRLR